MDKSPSFGSRPPVHVVDSREAKNVDPPVSVDCVVTNLRPPTSSVITCEDVCPNSDIVWIRQCGSHASQMRISANREPGRGDQCTDKVGENNVRNVTCSPLPYLAARSPLRPMLVSRLDSISTTVLLATVAASHHARLPRLGM